LPTSLPTIRRWISAWEVGEDVFGTDGPPSTLLGVSVLGWPDQLVEIEAVAYAHTALTAASETLCSS
jgi:hypothetical protein